MLCRRCGKKLNKYHESMICSACIVRRRSRLGDREERYNIDRVQRRIMIDSWDEYIGG